MTEGFGGDDNSLFTLCLFIFLRYFLSNFHVHISLFKFHNGYNGDTAITSTVEPMSEEKRGAETHPRFPRQWVVDWSSHPQGKSTVMSSATKASQCSGTHSRTTISVHLCFYLKYHRLGHLQTVDIDFSRFWCLGSQRSRLRLMQCLVEAGSFCFQDGTLCLCPPVAVRENRTRSVSLYGCVELILSRPFICY